MCILGTVLRRGRRRRSSKKGVNMEGCQGMCRSAGDQGGGQWAGQSPSRSSRLSERSGYPHLPPHLQPLSDTSDEEAEDRRSRTAPLGSGSTQEWATTELCGSRDGGNGQSYTELLQQGLSGDGGDDGMNLSFRLCSGRSSAASRTVIVNNHPDDDGGQLTVVARSSKSPALRLKKVGVDREAERRGKKWDNSMQQFKKVHHFQGLSGKQDFFQFSGKERLSKGFNFNMDRAVYDEILGSTAKSHTINPKNIAATGAPGGVHLPSATSANPESMGDGLMGALVQGTTTTRTGQQEILTSRVIKLEVGVLCVMSSRSCGRGKSVANLAVEAAAREKQGPHVKNKKRKLVHGGSSLARYVEDEEWVPERVASPAESDFEEEEEASLKRKSSRRGSGGLRIEDVGERRGGGGRAIMEDVIDVDAAAASRQGGGTAVTQQNRAPVPRVNDGPTAQEGIVPARTPATPWAMTTTDIGVNAQAIAQGNKRGAPQAGEGVRAGDVVGPGEDDEALVNRVRQRYTRDGIAAASKLWVDDLCFWNESEGNNILKLIQEALRKRGYHIAYRCTLNHETIDIARAIWMGEDWRIRVNPMVFHITLDMDMKLPLWFVDVDIKDRHENGELAAYQEASIQRPVGAFTSAVSMAEGIDDGRVSHKRLKSIADAMRIMLATTVWLMRMRGDDHRTHYDAWVFVQLTSKSTLITSMHHSFDARRHIMQVAIVIMDKLAKPPMTLVAPPLYIPDRASIGVKFSHDATLSSPMEAKNIDWLGTGYESPSAADRRG
ncbi:hypothetical protein CBR_g57902 [Chara braunii]|uniref:Uncharacterized protein n=1 Tax=Chara braunii TaxID=69332 RepID=A0A388MEF6_CHABU|nr:hypothetical protein CBR_g57902 [Chara braunii]|eukprot:GBG92946.1 hypothetical protein CBR_g57902 [Chara braunii]